MGSTATQTYQASSNNGLGVFSLDALTTGFENNGVGREALGSVTTGYRNNALGYLAGGNITTGRGNVLLGDRAGDLITTGSDNIIIGYEVDPPSATTSNHLNIGDVLFGDLANSKIGIGTSTPSEALTVNGNVEADAYYYSSDERLKKNIKTIDGAVETIKKLNPVSFNWRENDIASQGFIAQELEQVIPELVKTNSVNGLKAVQYANLTAVLTAGIQEQQKEIDYLKTMVEILKLRVNELESK